MSPESASALIDWFMNHFTSTHEESIIGAIVYEMFGLQDTFGQAMLNNLRVFLPVPPPRCFYFDCDLSQGIYPRTLRSIRSVGVLLDTGSCSPMH